MTHRGDAQTHLVRCLVLSNDHSVMEMESARPRKMTISVRFKLNGSKLLGHLSTTKTRELSTGGKQTS